MSGCNAQHRRAPSCTSNYQRPDKRKVNALQPQGKEIIVQGYCQDTPVNILLDTGAAVSLVSTRLIDTLGKTHEILPTAQIIQGLGKQVVPTKGEIELTLEIGNTKVCQNYIVCNDVDNEFLLGLDCMKKFEMRLDIPRGVVFTTHGQQEFLDKPISLKNRLKIRCNKTFKIPANTACFVMGKLPISNSRLNYEGVLEGYHKLAEKSGIFVTGSLSYSNKNLVPVKCLNVMPYDITVYKNQLIAFMEPFEKFQCVQSVHRVRGNSDFYDSTLDVPRLPTAEPEHVTRDKGKWETPEKLFEILGIDGMDISDCHKQQFRDL